MSLEKAWIHLFSHHQGMNCGTDWVFSLVKAANIGEGKFWIQIGWNPHKNCRCIKYYPWRRTWVNLYFLNTRIENLTFHTPVPYLPLYQMLSVAKDLGKSIFSKYEYWEYNLSHTSALFENTETRKVIKSWSLEKKKKKKKDGKEKRERRREIQKRRKMKKKKKKKRKNKKRKGTMAKVSKSWLKKKTNEKKEKELIGMEWKRKRIETEKKEKKERKKERRQDICVDGNSDELSKI